MYSTSILYVQISLHDIHNIKEAALKQHLKYDKQSTIGTKYTL